MSRMKHLKFRIDDKIFVVSRNSAFQRDIETDANREFPGVDVSFNEEKLAVLTYTGDWRSHTRQNKTARKSPPSKKGGRA